MKEKTIQEIVKKTPKFYVFTTNIAISPDDIADGFFIFSSNFDINQCEVNNFGLFELDSSTAETAIGVKMYKVKIYNDEKNLLFDGGVDESKELLKTLADIIPACILLMQQDIFDKFREACESIEIEVKQINMLMIS